MFIFDNQLITYILLGLSFLIFVIFIENIFLHIRISRILRGKKAKSLEHTIVNMGKEIDSLHSFAKQMDEYLTSVETRVQKSTQGVATVRFNPFKGIGGGSNQSFATAFINQHGDGVVISSLYSRERVSVFAKPISKFKSEYELTKEEKEAIAKANPLQ